MNSDPGAGRRGSRRKRDVARPRAGADPPLKALRVFNVAGQHLSFTKAASELKVTQAAVSHQVATLEEFLGVHLFRRSGIGCAGWPTKR